jgi:hypothetical protein
MYNTDIYVEVEVHRLDGFESKEPVFEATVDGKYWARGYDAETIAKRTRDFRHFDFRDLFIRNLYKERRNGK